MDKALENRENTIAALKERTDQLQAEKEAADRMVEVLKNELRLQTDHYETSQRSQADYYAQLAEKSVDNERQIQELLTRLTSEQNNKYRDQAEQEHRVRSTEDMAIEKVKVLQVELQKQEEFFKIQERNYLEQIEILKQEIVRARSHKAERDE